PLEREEERDQVRGADEERHPRCRREQKREELRHVVIAPSWVGAASPPGDVLHRQECRCETDGEDDYLAQRGPAVAVIRTGGDGVSVRGVDVEPDGEDDSGGEARD